MYRKERLTHWKDNDERGCRNRGRKEVGIGSRQEYIYTRSQSLVALQFQTRRIERRTRSIRVEDFVREISPSFSLGISFEFEKNERVHRGENKGSEELDGNRGDVRGALREWNRVCTACVRKVEIYFFSSISFSYLGRTFLSDLSIDF